MGDKRFDALIVPSSKKKPVRKQPSEVGNALDEAEAALVAFASWVPHNSTTTSINLGSGVSDSTMGIW
jgi:hypothetical protein